jgi:tRNA(fMet)-specific endonuclease VapC
MYVLDTNTLIYYFKGMGQVAQNLLACSPKDIGLPTVVLFELSVGILKSTSPGKRTRQLEQLSDVVNILSFGRNEAQFAAGIRADLEAKGLPIGPYDILIAATALSHNGILVTHNTQEFSRINNLQLEDWY